MLIVVVFHHATRFGFNAGSSVDALLDKEDVSLEALLDEDDLLQECKAQNTRLIDYFQRLDVLHKLLAYVSGQIDSAQNESDDGKGLFKCVHRGLMFALSARSMLNISLSIS